MENTIEHEGVRLISSRDAARILGISHDYIGRLCKKGKVTGKLISGIWFVNEESLRAYLLQVNKEKYERREVLREVRAAEYREAQQRILENAPQVQAAGEFSVKSSIRKFKVQQESQQPVPSFFSTTLRKASVVAFAAVFLITTARMSDASMLHAIRNWLPAAANFASFPDGTARGVLAQAFGFGEQPSYWLWYDTNQTLPETPASTPIADQPSIIERIIDRVVPSGSGISEALLNARLADLEQRLLGLIALVPPATTAAPVYYISHSSGIGGSGFDDIDITDSTFSTGSISDSSITSSTFEGSATLTNVTATNATSTNLHVSGSLGFGTETGLLQNASGTVSTLSNGSNGQVLKIVGGTLAWSTDVSGGGSSGAFATTSDDLAIYVADTSDVVIIGASATTTTGNIVEVTGNALFRNAVTSYGLITAPRFTATSSTASIFPYASTTALSATTLCLSSDCRTTWPTDGFSTTSSDYWKTQNNFFSTTSSDYYKSVNNFFSTTSTDYWKSVTDLFSTTSAIYFAHSSTTIPKTYTTNAFTALQSFTNASTSLLSALDGLHVGRTSTTTILGSATSTFGAGIQTTALNVTSSSATSTFANGIQLSSGCFALGGVCIGNDGSFSTTSSDYWKTQNNFFSTTSSDYWKTVNNFFSTTSSDYYKSVNNFFSTTSADFWKTANDFFSTTSAIHFVDASSTIPKTYTANTFTGLQTFSNASSTLFSSTYASTTNLIAGSATIGTLNLGAALTVPNGGTGSTTLTGILKGNGTGAVQTAIPGTDYIANATGDWTGTFDGLEGATYLANAFSTTSADVWKLNRNFFSTTSSDYWKTTVNFFSTTSADYWETQQTARSADDLTNNSIEDLNDVAAMTENYGDLFAWNGSAWTDFATSSLGIALSDTTGTLAVGKGGTGATTFSYGLVLSPGGTSALTNIATSSLGLLTTNVAEGSNLYYQDARVQTYLDSVNKGFFFSTTSADAWKLSTSFFSTTSSDYWKTANNFFSTTSAIHFVDASTTIPKTYTANVFTGLQTFTNASTTLFSSSYASSTNLIAGTFTLGSLNGPLQANNGLVSATSSVLAIYGGTGQTSYTLGDLLYANTASTLTKLPIGGTGTVLKVAGGVPTWGTDLTSGGGGGATAWSTTTDSLAIYPTDPTDVLIIGNSATATSNSILEVVGRSYFSQNVGIGTTSAGSALSIQGNIFLAGNIISTSTTASIFLYASTTALTVSGTASTTDLLVSSAGGSTGCAQFSVTGLISNTGTACGSGSGTFSWTPTVNFGVNTNATSTALSLLGGLNASSTVRFGNAGVGGFLFDSSTGNLGLGTTSPFATLQIATTTGKNLVLSDSGAGANLKHWLFSSQGGNLFIGTTTDSYATSTPSALKISNAGQVGIGTNNASLYQLAINNPGSGGLGLEVITSGSTANNPMFYSYDRSLTPDFELFVDSTATYIGPYANADMSFVNNAGTPRMTVAAGGNVGVGTTTPWALLSVNPNGISGPAFAIGSSTATLFSVTRSGVGSIFNFGMNSTSTVPNNQPYAWTIATSSTANPLFRVDTTSGSEGIAFGVSGSDVVIGDVGAPSNLIFEENSTIKGQGSGKTITIGANSDIITFGVKVGIGTSTPVSTLSIQGSLCVRDTGSCGTTNGTIYATTATLSDIDLAENYTTADASLLAGEIVSLDRATTTSGIIKRASKGDSLLGIISTKPGLLLGQSIKNGKPVALKGRVPLKVNMEGGPIAIGDTITISSIAGVGTKATTTAQTIGIALESLSTTGMIEVFVQTEMTVAEQDQKVINMLIALSSTELPIASNASSTEEEETPLSFFFANIFAHVGGWLADAGNGIAEIFAKTIRAENVYADTGTFGTTKTEMLCVGKICVTEEEFAEVFDADVSGGGDTPQAEEEPPAGEPEETPPPTEEPEETPPAEEPPAEEPLADLGATPPSSVEPEPQPEPTPTPTPAPEPEEETPPAEEPAPEPTPEPSPEPVPEIPADTP